ncbi:MAG: hypothetical protein NZ561_06775 [Phycisphaerae bacterium]|nr:hypothetical protein [Phycisphaerae bacterium]
MNWFLRILLLALLVGGWLAAARAVHIVRATNPQTGQDRFGIIPKSRWRFEDTYVDTRHWTFADLLAHPELVSHLARSPKADLLNHLVPPEHRSQPGQWLLRAVEGSSDATVLTPDPPATSPTTQPQ